MPLSSPDNDEFTVAFLLSKQAQFTPEESYSAELQSNQLLCEARCIAARWITKAHFIFNFNPLTVALAVNYMDRYLEQKLSLHWKAWMMELLSVACLSVAAKMEEVEVPALLDLQTDGMEHLFQAKTVQRMELIVLSALGWRLRSVTPFAFVEKAINRFDLSQPLKCSLMARVSELLLATFAEVEFLEFEPSVLAAASICCALEEALPVQADQLKLFLLEYIPLDTEKLRSCYMLMESLIVDPLYPSLSLCGHPKSPLSPNTVVYHIEDNSSVDNSRRSHYLASKPFVERIDLQEIALNPKRQRRF